MPVIICIVFIINIFVFINSSFKYGTVTGWWYMAFTVYTAVIWYTANSCSTGRNECYKSVFINRCNIFVIRFPVNIFNTCRTNMCKACAFRLYGLGAFTVFSYTDKFVWWFPSNRFVWTVVRIKPYIKVKHSVFIAETVFKNF